jgi:large subunit ribosomal protein L9
VRTAPVATAVTAATGNARAVPEAILLQDVETLGEQGSVVDVSKGYLRNYLIPRKLASPATRGAIETIRQRQAAAERAAREAIEKAQENVNLLNRTVLTIPQQAGADGRLFGSVTAQDIASAIREARGLRIDKRNVHLPEAIKNVGTYMVVVEVVDNVTATIKTMIVAKK